MQEPIDQSAGRVFPIVDRARFDTHPKSRKPRDRARMLYSPASEDWVTWTTFALLERYAPTMWWPDLVALANRENPRLVMPTGWHEMPQVQLWETVRSPSGYERASRERMRLSGNPAWVSRADDPRPVEGDSEIDITLGNDALLVFMEAKLTSDVSPRTTYDPRRDQIVRNMDCVLDRAGDRVPIFWMIARDTGADRAYTKLFGRYRDSPDALAALLPHHDADQVAKLAKNLSLIRWRDLVGRLGDMLPDDLDSEIAEVVRELDRRA